MHDTRKRFSMTTRLWSLGVAVAMLTTVAYAQTVRLVPHADLKTLDPLFNTAYITRDHGYMVFDTLFARNSQDEPKPQMVATA